MGVYIFSWEPLKKYLIDDENNPESSNDFGKNIIPEMLKNGLNLLAYRFDGYWKDVGTIHSLWEANMELLDEEPAFKLQDSEFKIYSRNPAKPPHYLAPGSKVKNCYITEGCEIYGNVEHSVIFEGVTISEGAVVKDSIIFPCAKIEKGAHINKAIIGSNTVISENAVIGSDSADANSEFYNSTICTGGITLIGPDVVIEKDIEIARNNMVTGNIEK